MDVLFPNFGNFEEKKKQSLIELSFSMLTLGHFGVFLGLLAIVVMQFKYK